MSPDHAVALIAGVLKMTIFIAGPMLAAALAGGLFVGIIQTATQINEASVGYVVKSGAVILAIVVVGPYATEKAVSYARESFASIAMVVR